MKRIIILMIMFCIIPFVYADEYILRNSNIMDAFVDATNPTTKYGDSAVLATAGNGGGGTRYRSYAVGNSTTILPPGGTILEAYYSVYLYSEDTIKTNDLHDVNITISEMEFDLTWNNQPCGTAFDDADKCNLTATDSVTSAGIGFQRFNVTTIMRRAYAEDRDISIGIIRTDAINDNHFFRSKDTGAGEQFKDNFTIILVLAGDLIPPGIDSSINNTFPFLNNNITLSANVTDETGLSFCQFIHNQTDLFIINHSVSGTVDSCNQTFLISLTSGNVINFSIRVNDTNNNFNQDDHLVTVRDITPPNMTLISPDNGTITNIIPFNITFLIADELNISLYCELRNISPSSELIDSGTFPQDINLNLTFGEGEPVMDQNFPSLNLTCFDNTDPYNNSATLLLNYTIDTVFPSMNFNSPVNGTTVDHDTYVSLSIDANCSDTNVFRFNITISNVSDRVFSSEIINTTLTTISIKEDMLVEPLGHGNYTINYTCADQHTASRVDDYDIKLNDDPGDEISIEYKTSSRNTFKILYLSGPDIEEIGTKKARSDDRYLFWFNSNLSETTKLNVFRFEIIGDQYVHYLPASSYKAHFITGDQWIDFEFNDPKAIYKVTLNQEGNWEIEITTSRTSLLFNSVGDLNVIKAFTMFTIDHVFQAEDVLKVSECPTSIPGVMILWMIIGISLFLITLGIMFKLGIIGILGSILLMVSSWFVAPCVQFFAFVLTFVSLCLLVYFGLTGFGLFGDDNNHSSRFI